MLVSIVKYSQLLNNMLYNEFPAGLSHHLHDTINIILCNNLCKHCSGER